MGQTGKGDLKSILSPKVLIVWFFIIIVTFAIQVYTIDVLPSLQQDEAQITDYGRLSLDPKSDWSVNWLIGQNKPLLIWSYIGPVISELAFIFGDTEGNGPRVASLIGGLIAASICFLWLTARGVPLCASGLLSLTLLLDPLFNLSQRMGRIDSWVFAICLASCWLLRMAAIKKGQRGGMIGAAGALTGMAIFVWPSAVLLFPLIGVELLALEQSEKGSGYYTKHFLSQVLIFTASGFLSAIIFSIPLLINLPLFLESSSNVIALNVNAKSSFWDSLLKVFDYHPWLKLIKAFIKTFSPLLPLLAIIGIFYKREKPLVVAFLAVLILIFSTLVYEFRVLYLLPYFVAFSAGIFYKLDENSSTSKALRRFAVISLLLVTVWGAGITLVVRTVLGMKGKSAMDRQRIYKIASESIGEGDHKVFLAFTYEFYFVGRSLGWQLYTPYILFQYDSEGNWIRKLDYKPEDKFIQLLSKMDYAVFSKGSVNQELTGQLAKSGLHPQQIISTETNLTVKDHASAENRIASILMWFLKGKEEYGSFLVFGRRKDNNKLTLQK